MSHLAREHYLASQVQTANSPRLHLMLLDGALRNAGLAQKHWDDTGHRRDCEDALNSCIKICGELVAGVRGASHELAPKFAALYAWAFRTLTEAKVRHDANALQEVVRLLEFERETWRLICEKAKEEAPATTPIPRPRSPGLAQGSPVASLSLEA